MPEELVPIKMIRRDLEDIPQYPLPQQYTARWYEPGFERHWLDIHLAADKYSPISLELFVKQFGTDHQLLSQRQCYLADAQGYFFATASAWFDDETFGQRIGLLHWLAILPDMQGKGLSKPLLTIVLNRMRKLDHKWAYLRTATVRIPAINLYRKFGFVPHIRSPEELKIWSSLQDKLKRPFDLDSLAANPVD